jgi:hypothetical protein
LEKFEPKNCELFVESASDIFTGVWDFEDAEYL